MMAGSTQYDGIPCGQGTHTRCSWQLLLHALLLLLPGYAIRAQEPTSSGYGGLIEQQWLPNYAIKDIYQDKLGRMWVATNAGLYKHNINNTVHYDITRFTEDKYLNNQLSGIVELDDGQLLVGTQSGLGLFAVADQTVTLVGNKDEAVNQIGTPANRSAIYVTDNRDVHRLTFRSSAERPLSKAILKSNAQNKKFIKVAAAYSDDLSLIGASDGLWLLRNGSLHPTDITQAVTSLLVDGKDVWVATDQGAIHRCTIAGDRLLAIARFTTEHTTGKAENIQEIKILNTDEVIAASARTLFFIRKSGFPDPTSVVQRTVFDQNAIQRIFVDQTRTLWIGSRNGLFTMSPQRLLTHFMGFDHRPNPPMAVNDMLLRSEDSLLLATNNAGIALLDMRTNRITPLDMPYKDVKLLRKAKNGGLLVLANNRFFHTDIHQLGQLKGAGRKVPMRGVNDVVEIAPGEYWLSHWRQKIIRIHDGKADSTLNAVYQQIIDSLAADAHVYVLEIDSRRNLWVGTRGDGLLRVNLRNRSSKKFTRANRFPEQIMCIFQDSHDRLWIGTRDKGLLLYRPDTDDFETFDQRNGLPSNTICAIQESADGNLWFSTLNGIARLSKGKIHAFHAYNKEAGIFSAEFSFNVTAEGAGNSVHFGTGEGIYRFAKLSETLQDAPLAWTGIDIIEDSKQATPQIAADDFSTRMLRQIEESGTIVLQRHENNLRIGFAKLDYAMPKQNSYLYRLLGHDTTWTVLQGEHSYARYADLPPGDYVFQVLTTNSADDWQRNPQSFALTIKPTFWETELAHILYAMLLGALIFVGYRIALRWKAINRKLRQEIEATKIYDQKMVHYADLSHEIKNRLTLILGPLEDALRNKKVNFQLLNRIYEQGQRLQRLSNQIMNIRKSDSGDFILTVEETDITLLVSKIVEDARPLATVKDIQILFEPAETSIIGWCDIEIVEIVITNVLNNAIKYCVPGDTVKLALEGEYGGEGNFLVCTVSDTGQGIPESELSKITQPFYRIREKQPSVDMTGKGIGLDLVTRLIKKHHGHFEIKSRVDEFTTVACYLPIDKHAFSMQELRPDLNSQPIVMADQRFRGGSKLILPEEPYLTSGASAVPGTRFRLLVVDDDPDLLTYLRELLSPEFDVADAGSADAAMIQVESAPIDLIICDLDMPGMNGLSFCRWIKDQRPYRHIPFVLLTGKDSEAQKLVAFEHGVDDFIEKPFHSELLTWRVKSLLKNVQQRIRLQTVIVPESQADVPETVTERFIQDVVDLIEQHIDKHYLNVDFLADELCMSRATFYRKMEEMFNEPPSSFIKKYRLKKALMFIQSGRFTLKQVADLTGFSNPKYFTKCFKAEFGVIPSAYPDPSDEPLLRRP